MKKISKLFDELVRLWKTGQFPGEHPDIPGVQEDIVNLLSDMTDEKAAEVINALTDDQLLAFVSSVEELLSVKPGLRETLQSIADERELDDLLIELQMID